MKNLFLVVLIQLSFYSYAQEGWFRLTPLPIVNLLLSVSNVNSNTAYAVGENGIILKTTDGGNDWIRQTSGTSDFLFSVFFVDTV